MTNGIFIGAESFALKASGIGRVARLVAKVLGEELESRPDWVAHGCALNDTADNSEFGFPVAAANRSRLRFLRQSLASRVSHSAYIYDHLGLARAHLRLPFSRQPFLSFMYGIDVWEQAPRRRIVGARRADQLLVISNYTLERAESCHGRFPHAQICWLATESDDLPNVVRRSGPPTVLIVGRIDWPCYKGHVEVVSAWPRVVAAVPDSRLVIAGDGDGLHPLRQLAAGLPCADHIEFRGFVPESQMDALWASATVFAMPSRKEGFGLVYIEAMRHGVPVIGSVHDACQEVNVDGETGFNVNLDRPGELAERLIQLLRNPDAAAKMGQAGIERWLRHFRYARFRERFVPVLRKLVQQAA